MESAILVLIIAASAVFSLYGWDLLVSLAGMIPYPEPPQSDNNTRRFAILVCAHNEAPVVSGVIESLLDLDYPAECFEVFVVADNCTDATAAVARASGATVLERTDPDNRTKGYALRWGMERLFETGGYDSICVFDADNLVMPNFLRIMNAHLGAGDVAIQAYLDTKNPFDTWVTRCIGLAYFVTNRFWLRSRARLGLPTTLGGTGFCLEWRTAEKYEWDPGSLADDLDLTMRLLWDGIRVTYTPHTRTYDEKPITARTSLRQRSRWMQGHNDVAIRWTPRMLRGVFGRPLVVPALHCFDALLHLWQPIRILSAFAVLIAIGVAAMVAPAEMEVWRAFLFTTPGWGLAILVFGLYPAWIAVREGATWRLLPYLPHMALFSLTWIPAIVVGLARVRRRVWIHTPHGS